jgi:hypothetical protein
VKTERVYLLLDFLLYFFCLFYLFVKINSRLTLGNR